MPQLNTPYTYLDELVQFSALALLVLTLVVVYIIPSVTLQRMSITVTAVNKSSPLDQFSVLVPGLGSSLGMTLVGVYALIAFGVFTTLLFGLLPGALLVSRSCFAGLIVSAYDTARSVVGETASVLGWLGAVFTLILVVGGTNLLGNIPGGYCVATSVVVAGALSVAIWLWVLGESLILQGFRFWGSFVPSGTPLLLVPILVPIEAISYVARAFSLGVRLFSNILAGHTLLAILAGFLLAGLNAGWLVGLLSVGFLGLYVALVFLEIAVSLIQAYVFSVLTVSYLAGSC